MVKQLIFLLVLSAILFQCTVQEGVKISSDQMNILEVGKTKKLDVIHAFGMPYSEGIETVNVDGINFDILSYIHVWSDWVNDKGKIVKFEFKKDTLNAFLILSIFEEDQIPINMNTANFFKKGETTKAEIITKIGSPSGVNHLPSSFKISTEIPEATQEVIRYFSSPATNFDALYEKNRYLIFFLDSKELLLDYKYLENINSF